MFTTVEQLLADSDGFPDLAKLSGMDLELAAVCDTRGTVPLLLPLENEKGVESPWMEGVLIDGRCAAVDEGKMVRLNDGKLLRWLTARVRPSSEQRSR